MADATADFSFAYMQEAFVATLLVLAKEEISGNIKNDDDKHDEDDLEQYKLWRVFREQAAILRRQIRSGPAVESPTASNSDDNDDDDDEDSSGYNTPSDDYLRTDNKKCASTKKARAKSVKSMQLPHRSAPSRVQLDHFKPDFVAWNRNDIWSPQRSDPGPFEPARTSNAPPGNGGYPDPELERMNVTKRRYFAETAFEWRM